MWFQFAWFLTVLKLRTSVLDRRQSWTIIFWNWKVHKVYSLQKSTRIIASKDTGTIEGLQFSLKWEAIKARRGQEMYDCRMIQYIQWGAAVNVEHRRSTHIRVNLERQNVDISKNGTEDEIVSSYFDPCFANCLSPVLTSVYPPPMSLHFPLLFIPCMYTDCSLSSN